MASLQIITEPSTGVANVKSESLFWEIQNSGFVLSQGTKATFSITFQDFAEGNAVPVSIKGVFFVTDDSTPFTETTFKSEADGELTALNFSSMLALNLNFIDFVIYVAGPIVTVTSTKEGVLPSWTFSFASFVNPPTLSQTNGTTYTNKDQFLFWDLYEGAKLIAGTKKVDFAPNGANGFARISFDPSYLFEEYQPRLSLISWFEDRFYIDFQFRAGLAEQNSACQQQTKEALLRNYTAVNALFQLKEDDNFSNYEGALAKWVTGNPLNRTLKNNFYEVAGIWLKNDGTYRAVNPFLIEFKITLPGGDIEFIASSPNPTHKFWFVPTGTLNGSYSGLLELKPEKVEIQVFAFLPDDSRVEYSQKMTRQFYFMDCDCSENFIYLGDRGSFDTIHFGELKQVKQNVTATQRRYSVALNYADQVRGLKNVDSLQSVGFSSQYQSDPIAEWNMEMFAQLERSKQVYRIVKIGEAYKLERVRIGKGEFVNLDKDAGARISLEVPEAVEAKFHK